MIPMRVYFKNIFFIEFLAWYHSNPEIVKKMRRLSIENISKRIVVSEELSPSDGLTPQIVITAKPYLIQAVDNFLLKEKHFIAFKEKYELRLNLCKPKEHPWL